MAHTANVINAFLAPLTVVGGAMWDQQKQGQGQPPRPTQLQVSGLPTSANIVLQLLLEPVIHSTLSCESLTKHCVMWWRHTQSSQQGQNHTTTKQRDRLFSEMPTTLTGDAPPPYHGGFSLWEHCSYPVNFLWARRFLTQSPTQAERVILLGCFNCYRVLLLLQTRTGPSPSHSGCCCCFSIT